MSYTLKNTRSDGRIIGFSSFYNGTHASFEPLSKKVIFQAFSFVIPLVENEDDPAMYEIIKSFIPELTEMGVTDIWWPPPYKALSENAYQEGYAVSDRYDVGEFSQGYNNLIRTKYGTKEQLMDVLSYVHEWGLRNICDIVPNQMYMSDLAVVPGKWSANSDGSGGTAWYGSPGPISETNKPVMRPLLPLFVEYTEGGGPGQAAYGHFPYWYYKYFNGIGTTNNSGGTGEGTGPYIILRDDSYTPYRFYGNGNPSNYLPTWLQEAYNANNYINIQSTGTYLLVNQGWVDFVHFIPYACYYTDQLEYEDSDIYYVASATSAHRGFHRPYKFNQVQSFLDYLRQENISGWFTSTTTDDEILTWVKQYVGSSVGKAMGTWITQQPGYSGNSFSGMPSSWIVYSMNSDPTILDFSQFVDDETLSNNEFLLGTDVNNNNQDVQRDTVNWQEFLLDLGYDGFRFDASQWYSEAILTNSTILMSNRYGDDITNHLSVLEAYDGTSNDGGQSAFETVNSWGQLSYDTGTYYSLWNCLFLGFAGGTLLNVVQCFGGANSSGYPSDMDLTLLPGGPYAGGQFRGGAIQNALNWTFITNHDQEKSMMMKFSADNGSPSGSMDELRSMADQWTDDRRKAVKKHAPYNIVPAYTYMLLLDFAIPSLYYGDFFDSQEDYMSVKSPYYAAIKLVLSLRNKYCCGQQFNEFFVANGSDASINDSVSTSGFSTEVDSIAQIRFGEGRDTGMVHIMSLGQMLSYTITVPFGKYHANQTVKNVFAIGGEYAQTDENGNFDVFVTPQSTVLFQGYFSLWIPI